MPNPLQYTTLISVTVSRDLKLLQNSNLALQLGGFALGGEIHPGKYDNDEKPKNGAGMIIEIFSLRPKNMHLS